MIADCRLPRVQGSGIVTRSSILYLHPFTRSPAHLFSLSPCHSDFVQNLGGSK